MTSYQTKNTMITSKNNVWDTTPPTAWKKFVAGKSLPVNPQKTFTPHFNSYNRPHYYSAGVLPYAIDAGGNLVFLLGKDKDGNWSDFGGRSEQTELSILGSEKDCLKRSS